MRISARLHFGLVVVLAGLSGNAFAVTYYLTPLGPLTFRNRGPYDVRSFSLSNSGKVLGQTTVNGHNQATTWASGLVLPQGYWSTGSHSYGFAIDMGGNIVAELDDNFANNFGGRKAVGQSWVTGLYPTGITYTTPRGTNNVGEVVGIATQLTFQGLPCIAYYQSRIDGNTRPILITAAPSGATSSLAFSISDTGYIGGVAILNNNPNQTEAVVWRRVSATQVNLLLVGPIGSAILAVNGAGASAGYTATGAGAWTVGGSNIMPTGTPGVATSINASNVVVGNTVLSQPTDTSSRAFIVFPGQPRQDLNSLVVNIGTTVLYSASAINDVGQIVGYGSQGGFLLTPVLVGDMNCDGVIDFSDSEPFATAILDDVAYDNQYPNCDSGNGDMNGDGHLDGLDISGFVEILID